MGAEEGIWAKPVTTLVCAVCLGLAPVLASADTPYLVRDLNPEPDPYSDSDPTDFVDVDGLAFFVAHRPESGRELWVSDGTEGGTVLVKDICPGPSGSYPEELTNVDGTLFFVVTVFMCGPGWTELWKSDGTQPGTVLVKAGFGDYYSPHDLTPLDGTLFFSANVGNGGEFWKSDGTEIGTVPVADSEFAHVHLFDAQGRLLMLVGGPSDEPGGTPLPIGVAIAEALPEPVASLVPSDFSAVYFFFVSNSLPAASISLFAVGERR